MKALALDARVILMDEPTGWLAASEVAKLHATIRTLKARGVGIVYISHVLDEIFAVCDTLTIMRDGRVIAESAVADIDRAARRSSDGRREAGARIGAGGAPEAPSAGHRRGAAEAREKLGKRGVFEDVSFDLYAGEILCITGLIGSKRTELVRTLFGSDRFDSGTLEIDGQARRFRAARTGAMASGIGFVPEDRHREGLMLDMTVTENLAMATLERFRRGLLLSRSRMVEAGRRAIASLSIQPPDGNAPGQAAVGRQPAEGAGRQMAQPRAAHPDPRRADGRRRRRRQGGDLRDPAPRARARRGGPGRVVRSRGGDDDRRPDRRHGLRPADRDSRRRCGRHGRRSCARSAEEPHERRRRDAPLRSGAAAGAQRAADRDPRDRRSPSRSPSRRS